MRDHATRIRFAALALPIALAAAAIAPRPAHAAEGDASCPTAVTQLHPAPLVVTAPVLDAARHRAGAPSVLSGFDIVLVPGRGLAASEGALAAFERAAARWEAVIADPIVVTIDADFADLGNPAVIGQASSVLLQGPYDLIRDALVADASSEPDDDVVASLPTAERFSASLPPGFALAGNAIGSKASLKALGFAGLDDAFGPSDATITFNSAFAFDLDSGDGVTPGTIDLETVAAHEIGHALGFSSMVDGVDGAVGGLVSPTTLDLYRFASRGGNPPSAARFARVARSVVPGRDAVFDDVASEARLSTGVFGGDGRQASHWKDDALTGAFVGIMDPTLAAGTVEPITAADRRALDVIGYDIVPASLCGAAPEPAASCFQQTRPLAATVAITDGAADARDQLQWSWNEGEATSLADLPSPHDAEARFEVCVYDGSGGAQPLHAAVVAGGETCGARPCWRSVAQTGWTYGRSSSAGVGDGITQVKLRTGADGRSQLTVKGRGVRLAPPDPALTPPVTVQLVARDGQSTRCWQTTFTGGVTRNDDEQFKARGP